MAGNHNFFDTILAEEGMDAKRLIARMAEKCLRVIREQGCQDGCQNAGVS